MVNEGLSESPAPGAAELRRRHLPWGTLLVFLLFWGLYVGSGSWRHTPFNAHVHLADAMLHGRFEILDCPGHFERTHYNGHVYLAYGIAPSLLMLPFVALWGLSTHQALFNAALAAGAVALWWSTLGHQGVDRAKRIVLTAMLGAGSLFWFYGGHDGATWPLMHVSTVFGLMLAMREVYGNQRGWLVGLGFGIAVLSRQTVFLALPFFVAALWRDDRPAGASPWRKLLTFGAGLGVPMAFNAYYNFARFGSLMDNGYKRVILEGINPQFIPWGLFHPNYLAQNLQGYFLRLPERIAGFPWLNPTMDGFAIWISLPALVLVLLADYRRRDNLLALVSIVAIFGFYLVYHWSGYSQFGRRYSLDFLPLVMLLVASGARKCNLSLLWLLTLGGMVVEVWGFYWWWLKGW